MPRQQPTSASSTRSTHLLPALARALDVRDVFQHLSTVASRIVPHDEANLALVTDDGSQFRLYASTSDGATRVRMPGKNCPIGDADEAQLFDVVPGPERGLRSGLSVPVRIDDAWSASSRCSRGGLARTRPAS